MKKDLDLYMYQREDIQAKIAAYKVRSYDEYTWYKYRLCVDYIYLYHYPALQTLLKPYLTARFMPSWQFIIPNLDKLIQQICDELDALSEASEEFKRIDRCVYVKRSIIASLKSFLQRYREGAFVVLSLLGFARRRYKWENPDSDLEHIYSYPGLNMLWAPEIVGIQPIEIFQLVKRMNEIMLAKKYEADCLLYFNFDNFFRTPEDPYVRKYKVEKGTHDWWLNQSHFFVNVTLFIEGMEERIDIRMLTLKVQQRQDWLYKQLSKTELDWWNNLGETERLYFFFRACDIAFFGITVADRTWPQPVIPGMATERVSRLISLLVTLLTDVQKELEELVTKLRMSYQDNDKYQINHCFKYCRMS